MTDTGRVHLFEQGDGDWWAECLICNAWVSISNATRRIAEQKFGRHLQNEHPSHVAANQRRTDEATLRELLNSWDPIGVHDPITDFPSDEYDCLYSPLLARLRRGDSADEIATYLDNELKDHFGLNPRLSQTREFAQKLVTSFANQAEH